MRVVLDTNVLISALLFDGNPEKIVLSILSGSGELILSSYIIVETTHVLEGKFRVNPSNLTLLQRLLNDSESVYFKPFLHIIEDEPDNRILETALKGKARYIVTGDKLLLKLKRYKGVNIVSVKEYMEINSFPLQLFNVRFNYR